MLLSIVLIFVVGYVFISLEDVIHLNKTATALVTGVLCWAIFAVSGHSDNLSGELSHHFEGIAEILIFLLGAMTIVELIDAHDGFSVITDRISTSKPVVLLWIIALLSFFFSAVLDNLTTAIVMVSLLRKLMQPSEVRKIMAGVIIIAANAGGAWSPIGDVTTTMLWIGGQISTLNVIKTVFFPSLVCMILPLIALSYSKQIQTASIIKDHKAAQDNTHGREIILSFGLGGLLFVPIFKTITHLPPFMGIMLVLGIIWLISEIIHKDKDEENRRPFTASYALSKIDTPSILFFLGILLAVSALEVTGLLHECSQWLSQTVKNLDAIVVLIGLVSAVVDNVPLVAATMGMYDLQTYPLDHRLWQFLAYCSGTGGSILIIGSAAGVAIMGLERIGFGWYLRKISWLALLGYLGGAITYVFLN